MTYTEKVIICSVAYLILLFVAYYFLLPVFNFGSVGFYFYLLLIIGYVISVVLMSLSERFIEKNLNKPYK